MKKLFLVISFLLFSQISNSNVVVLNGLTHVHNSEAGKTITGVVKLKNTKDTEQRVIIYFNDLFQECGKATILTADVSHERSLLKWISTNINERVLKPHEEYELVYTIEVPNDSSLDGSYWGVLMIEVEKPIKEDDLSYGVKLESKIRYGIQIITDIKERKPSELDFYNVEINDNNGAKMINVDVQNNGIFYVQPTLVLEVFNENGEQAKKEEVKFKKIYPGYCKAFTLDISDLPKGVYSAVLVADYGENMYAVDLEFENK
ncbi:hypothetical protein [Lutibacter sp.]